MVMGSWRGMIAMTMMPPDSTTDADCDGVQTGDDCKDYDPNSTTVFTDADCDDTITADDCDDNDPNSTIVATGADWYSHCRRLR